MAGRFVDEVARQPELRREQALQRLMRCPISALLPEQERLVEVYREAYFRVGSSTAPADRTRAEAAITKLYAGSGAPLPRFEWGASPRWGAERVAELGAAVGDPLWAMIGDSLWAMLGESMSLHGVSLSSLGSSLWTSLSPSLWTSLGLSLRSSLASSLGSSLGNWLGGSQEAYCVSHYIYGHEVLSVPYSYVAECKLYLRDEVVRSCGWWWPYSEVCICTDRPELLEWTEEQPPKLRRVCYRDGWGVSK